MNTFEETQTRLSAALLKIAAELAALEVAVVRELAAKYNISYEEAHAEISGMGKASHGQALEAAEDVSPARAAQLDNRPLLDE